MSEASGTCQICNWTNSGCLNLGDPNKEQKWVCHGCIKRTFDKLRSLCEGDVLVIVGKTEILETQDDKSFLESLTKAHDADKSVDIIMSFPLMPKKKLTKESV